MKKHLDKSQPLTPGRCHCCGHLMIMLRLNDPFMDASSPQGLGWRCLFCDHTEGWEAMTRRYEALQTWPTVGRQTSIGRVAEIRL